MHGRLRAAVAVAAHALRAAVAVAARARVVVGRYGEPREVAQPRQAAEEEVAALCCWADMARGWD